MKIVITNREGACIRDVWRISGNVLCIVLPGTILDYIPTDSDILGFYEIRLPGDVEGYVSKEDADIVEGVVDFTEVEAKYLTYLLNYAAEKLFVHSTSFLRSYGLEIDEVDYFISELKKKIEKAEHDVIGGEKDEQNIYVM